MQQLRQLSSRCKPLTPYHESAAATCAGSAQLLLLPMKRCTLSASGPAADDDNAHDEVAACLLMEGCTKLLPGQLSQRRLCQSQLCQQAAVQLMQQHTWFVSHTSLLQLLLLLESCCDKQLLLRSLPYVWVYHTWQMQVQLLQICI